MTASYGGQETGGGHNGDSGYENRGTDQAGDQRRTRLRCGLREEGHRAPEGREGVGRDQRPAERWGTDQAAHDPATHEEGGRVLSSAELRPRGGPQEAGGRGQAEELPRQGRGSGLRIDGGARGAPPWVVSPEGGRDHGRP